MDDQINQLESLTDQRIPITLGGKSYTARQATTTDLVKMLRYVQEHGGNFNDYATMLDASLYLLTELFKPDLTVTPEELGSKLALKETQKIPKLLEKLGFIRPQTSEEAEK